ncbi:MAG: four helix bundle protein [Anaerolineae bacterium]|nr:four helix bundle protein [Anaerolineae bacterium]
MNSDELKKRTKDFGIRVIRLVESLPTKKSANMIGHQLMRSATSVGANYRSACRGRSKAEFIAKLGISIEKADESLYWMEIILDTGLAAENQISDLMKEAHELVAILTAAVKTARSNIKKSGKSNQQSEI